MTAGTGHARLPPSPLAFRRVVLARLCSHLGRPLEWIACDFCPGELLQVAQESSGAGTEGGELQHPLTLECQGQGDQEGTVTPQPPRSFSGAPRL